METDIKSMEQSKLVKFGIFAVVLLIVFLLGLVPMWLKARTGAAEHEVTKKLLVKSELKGLVTTAIVDSGRGEYESARQDVSNFFTRLQSDLDKGEESAYSKQQREKLKAIFGNRDAMITMLAQRDQASVQRLSDLHNLYRDAVGEKEVPAEKPLAENSNTSANTQ